MSMFQRGAFSIAFLIMSWVAMADSDHEAIMNCYQEVRTLSHGSLENGSLPGIAVVRKNFEDFVGFYSMDSDGAYYFSTSGLRSSPVQITIPAHGNKSAREIVVLNMVLEGVYTLGYYRQNLQGPFSPTVGSNHILPALGSPQGPVLASARNGFRPKRAIMTDIAHKLLILRTQQNVATPQSCVSINEMHAVDADQINSYDSQWFLNLWRNAILRNR